MKLGDVGYLVVEGIIEKLIFVDKVHDDGGRNLYHYKIIDGQYSHSDYKKLYSSYEKCFYYTMKKLISLNIK